MEQGLYLVATPIGNLGDMTYRGVEVLKNVDVIGAEDTRRSRVLLDHYQIKTPLLSYHEHNEAKRRPELLARLRDGGSVALISDAGTPGISDPGADLAAAAAKEGIPIHPVPGGNAVLSAVIASGLPCRRFAFEGFLPRVKKERNERLAAVSSSPLTTVLYISPHRLREDLRDLAAACGDRPAALCREMTKLHETFYYGTLGSLRELAGEQELKGEMALVVAAAEGGAPPPDEATLKEEVRVLLRDGVPAKTAARIVAERYHMKKNQIYPYTIDAEEGE